MGKYAFKPGELLFTISLYPKPPHGINAPFRGIYKFKRSTVKEIKNDLDSITELIKDMY